MKLVYPSADQNELLARIAEKRLDGNFRPAQCMAFMDEDRLAGIVVYFNYRWPDIEVAFYCDDPKWARNRGMVAEALSYPFIQLNCQRVTALIEKQNKRSRKMVKRLGFVEEGKLRNAGTRGDLFVYGLLPNDYRLKRYGQKIDSGTAASA